MSGAGSSPSPASPPATPGASIPSPDTLQPVTRVTPAAGSRETVVSEQSEASQEINKEENYTDNVKKENNSEQTKIPSDGIIVTEKADNNLLDEMPDTKMTDLSQTRQYSSYESMGDDTILSCGTTRVGSLPQPTGGSTDRTLAQEVSTSRSMSPAQFLEPSPVRPRITTESPSCSRRSLSMEVDDNSERNSQTEQQEPMEVSYICVFLMQH